MTDPGPVMHPSMHGIPCVWPTYDRYVNAERTAFGRHSGTIWPQVNTAWAMATSLAGRRDLAWLELEHLAGKACRDVQFAEIYHPVTGEIYGGMQELPAASDGPVEWAACRRQSWYATGYIGMILSTLLGLQVTEAGLTLAPFLPDAISHLSFAGLRYRDAALTVTIERTGGAPTVSLNGQHAQQPFVPDGATGPQHIAIGL